MWHRPLLFALVGLAGFARADQLAWELRSRFSPSQEDALAMASRFDAQREPWRWALGAQVALSSRIVQRGDYLAEAGYAPLPGLLASLRLSHTMFPVDGVAATHAVIRGGFDVTPLSFLGVSGAFGWYERFGGLSGASLVPFSRAGVRDHDFVVAFGLRIHAVADGWGAVQMGTFDDYEVYNLNSPYVQLAWHHRLTGTLRLRTYARYRLLLGFGRPDEILVGIGTRAELP